MNLHRVKVRYLIADGDGTLSQPSAKEDFQMRRFFTISDAGVLD